MPAGPPLEGVAGPRRPESNIRVHVPQAVTTSRPLRVALCITGLEYGGAEKCLAELASRLDRTRFEPVVYSLLPRPAEGRPSVAPRLEQAGVETHFVGVRRAWQFPLAVRRLAKSLRQQQPDVVQTFLFHANIVGRLAARRADVPHVLSGIRVAERRGRWRLRLDAATAGNVERHVCVSQAVADHARTVGGLPADRLVVISNGIEVAPYATARPIALADLGMPAGRRLVTYVGRLDSQKRVDWLLKLSGRWLPEAPEHDLLIVGNGPQKIDMLKRLAERCGIEDRVHFVGWRGDVPAILAASDLLVLPSAWEGMPNAILEAMAAGLPVVATAAEGVRELLGRAADAQAVAIDDADGFAAAISLIISNDNLARDLGAQNRRRAESDFSLAGMVRRYEEMFERAASGQFQRLR